MLELPFGNAIRVYIGIPMIVGRQLQRIKSYHRGKKRKERKREKTEEAVYTASHEYSNRAARHQVSGFISMRCQPVGFPGPVLDRRP